MLDKDISLAETIRMLFWEQGITITSIHMAIGMAMRILVEVLLPGGGGRTGSATAVVGEWIRNKSKALARLTGRLGVKAAEVLPGIIGVILSWILNRAADLVD